MKATFDAVLHPGHQGMQLRKRSRFSFGSRTAWGADTIVVNDLSGTDPTEYETEFGGVAAPTGALGGKESF